VSWVQNVDITALVVSNGNLVSAISVKPSLVFFSFFSKLAEMVIPREDFLNPRRD
jgi:hypothetical protein